MLKKIEIKLSVKRLQSNIELTNYKMLTKIYFIFLINMYKSNALQVILITVLQFYIKVYVKFMYFCLSS